MCYPAASAPLNSRPEVGREDAGNSGEIFLSIRSWASSELDEERITPIVSCSKEGILQSAYQPSEPEIMKAGKDQSLLNLQPSTI